MISREWRDERIDCLIHPSIHPSIHPLGLWQRHFNPILSDRTFQYNSTQNSTHSDSNEEKTPLPCCGSLIHRDVIPIIVAHLHFMSCCLSNCIKYLVVNKPFINPKPCFILRNLCVEATPKLSWTELKRVSHFIGSMNAD